MGRNSQAITHTHTHTMLEPVSRSAQFALFLPRKNSNFTHTKKHVVRAYWVARLLRHSPMQPFNCYQSCHPSVFFPRLLLSRPGGACSPPHHTNASYVCLHASTARDLEPRPCRLIGQCHQKLKTSINEILLTINREFSVYMSTWIIIIPSSVGLDTSSSGALPSNGKDTRT